MLSDLRFAFRSLRATPGFTAVALIVLALGIGATTAIYSVVDAVSLRGLPYQRSDRLMLVNEIETDVKRIDFGGYVAAPNFFDWRAQQTSFEDLAAFQYAGMTQYPPNGEPEILRAMSVSASLIPMLRAAPAVGRLFTKDNEVAGNNHVAVISHALWLRKFNGDANVVGKTFTVGDVTQAASGRGNYGVWQVIGVMPEGFQFPAGLLKPIDIWAPYVPSSDEYPRGTGDSRNYNAQVIGRLKDGVTPQQAYADIAQITGRLKGLYPKWFAGGRWVQVLPLHESMVGKTRGWMFLLLGSVAFVLLIACVNVANLMLARATARSRDVGVRAALGASRWQLARALLAESLTLSVIGTALGLAVAYWGVSIMRTSLPPSLPRLADVGISARVLVMCASAAIVTGVGFGLIPAIQFSRPQLSSALREGGRSGQVGMARQSVRTALLIAEVALAVVLLIGSGLFISSFVKLTTVDLGIDTANLTTISVNPRIDFSKDRVAADTAKAAVAISDVYARVRAIPGVETAALMSGSVPLGGGWSRTSIEIPGRPPSTDSDDSPDQKNISADYFRTVRVPLLSGREFTEADSAPDAEPVLIINDIAVDRFFRGTDPVGQTVKANGQRRIIGVVRAVRLGGPEAPLRAEIYTPMSRTRGYGATLIVRSSREAGALSKDLRAAVHAVLPTVVVPETQTFQSMYEKLIVQRKFNMIVLAVFGGLAMVIAAVGIYGVMAYIVEQRTQEIGVRMALGAEPAQVLRMILSRAALFMVIGVVIGLGAGWALARFVSAFLFRVEPHNMVVYGAAAMVLILAGLIAAFVPARRAANVDPVTALR